MFDWPTALRRQSVGGDGRSAGRGDDVQVMMRGAAWDGGMPQAMPDG
ncbi:hypothetical protein [Tuwongella immobilis]|nr:hypothetical protein [Tuwongella immobilis]